MAGTILDRWFGLPARGTDVGTEVRAGVTTFMVMAYIIFVNPIVLGYVGVPGLWRRGWGSTRSSPSSSWPGAASPGRRR